MEHARTRIQIEELLRHEQWVRRIARGLVHGEDAVDEVVQRTWWDALRAPPRDATNPRGWLGTVARHAARREVRRERRRREVHADAAAQRPTEAPAPDAALERIELQRRVAQCVLALDEPYRTVVVQRFYEDRSPAQIGADRGASAATVRTQLARGLARLRERLDGLYRGDSRDWRAAALLWLRRVDVGSTGAASGARVATRDVTAARPHRAAARGLSRGHGLLLAGAALTGTIAVSISAWVLLDETDAPVVPDPSAVADGGAPPRLGTEGTEVARLPVVRGEVAAEAIVAAAASTPPPAAPTSAPEPPPTPPPPEGWADTTVVLDAGRRREDVDGMVLVPGGEVLVGTDPRDVARLGQGFQAEMVVVAGETPRHVAAVGSFLIDRTEVTNHQWRVYLDAVGREPSDTLVEYGWPGGAIPDGQAVFPVTNVSLPEVLDFLAWAGKRLPTEEEWTRAARGDDARTFPWGDGWDGAVVKYGGLPPATPVEVDAFPDGASPYGVHQMAGNVFEWTDSPYTAFDGFEPIPYRRGEGDVVRLTPAFDPARRVAKGGCFVSTRDQSRVDYRLSLAPGDSDAALGFRAVRTPVAGVDAITHAYHRLLPTAFAGVDALDLDDVLAVESWSLDHAGGLPVVTGRRGLVLAHRRPARGLGLPHLRARSLAEPLVLGLLSTTEDMARPDLPAGDYVVSWRARGTDPALDGLPRGRTGAEPREDVAFPTDRDVILFSDVDSVVVGWVACPTPTEVPAGPATLARSEDGRTWRLAFSLDVLSRQVPRFVVPLELRAPLLEDG